MKIRCVVSCRDADGTPDFYPVVVQCTEEQYDEGEHYEAAKDRATLEAYEDPGLVYDENDGPDWLFAEFDWNDNVVPVTTVGELL